MIDFSDLEGDLNEAGTPKADKPGTTSWTNPCPKCRGTGRFTSYSGRDLGACFMCKGAKVLTFKTSPEQRERAQAKAHSHKAAKAHSKAEAGRQFWTDHDAEYKWCMAASARGFEFAGKMLVAVGQYGSLTTNQLAAVQRLIAQDVTRNEAQATKVEAAKGIDVSRIATLFATAREAKLKKPRLRIGDVELVLAPERGKNPGAVYVTRGEDYLGKIVGGIYEPSRMASSADVALVQDTAADPLGLAVAYGRRTGNCACCGRQLTDPVSVANGIGPICQTKWGM